MCTWFTTACVYITWIVTTCNGLLVLELVTNSCYIASNSLLVLERVTDS